MSHVAKIPCDIFDHAIYIYAFHVFGSLLRIYDINISQSSLATCLRYIALLEIYCQV